MQHVLKGDPALGDLEHVQVDGPGLMHIYSFMTGTWISCSLYKEGGPLRLLTHSRCLC